MTPPMFVFDSSPLVASCQFAVGRRVVAEIALACQLFLVSCFWISWLGG
jgi:hypothetical protein